MSSGSIPQSCTTSTTASFGPCRSACSRRAAFAAATQHHPDLFVLDEPTSGVSPLARSDLWDLIRDRAEVGAAVLVSTHYMDEAEQADRLVVMADGLVVAEGSVTDVIGGRQTVEVVTDHWSEAFMALDRGGRSRDAGRPKRARPLRDDRGRVDRSGTRRGRRRGRSRAGNPRRDVGRAGP